MGLLARDLGGKVEKAPVREYGRMEVRPSQGAALFSSGKPFNAWMSHGDSTLELPGGFALSAKSASGSIAAMENPGARLFAIQFHPEVTHTEGGTGLLKRFLEELA